MMKLKDFGAYSHRLKLSILMFLIIYLNRVHKQPIFLTCGAAMVTIMSEDGQSNCMTSRRNFIQRFSSLMAVSSTCNSFRNVYNKTKDKYPVVASVWEVSEKGIKRTAVIALKSIRPVLEKLQPQIAVVNDYACKGLDHLEEKFPVVHKDSTKIASDLKEMAVGKMRSIKDKVTNPFLHVSDKAVNVAVCRFEKMKVFVNESVILVLSSGIGRSITNNMNAALSRSQQRADFYLPSEDGNDEAIPSEETINSSKLPIGKYMKVHLLVSKLYNHTYKHIVMFVQNAEKKGIATLGPEVCPTGTSAKENPEIASINSKAQDLVNRWVLSWLLTSTNGLEGEQKEGAIVEPEVLDLCRNFQSIFVTNLNKISNVAQMKMQQVFATVQKLNQQLWSNNLIIFLGCFISQIKGKLWDAWEALIVKKDHVLSYLVSILLLPGMSAEEDETKFEMGVNRNRSWRSLVPRPAKEGIMAQISKSPVSPGREADSTSRENSNPTTVIESEGVTSASLNLGQNDLEETCPESMICNEHLQKDLEQAEVSVFQEKQGESGLRCPKPS
ncbi:perilipin-2 isoform X1 [Chiloscyllium plagiosum]|uniref:perilipin-2 isoform X1 n=2 Tax=Chiloscyllium plagiosum TaxID=36176 RepID=UPI001CB86F04|nr:perilipin-2 isoform X1 [Chiloscyllium plagiosum]